jgi:hypothetical protein
MRERTNLSSIVIRNYLLNDEDEIFRISNAKMERMTIGSEKDQIILFAGLKVRMAEILVTIIDRIPVEVVRASYSHLYFSEGGSLNRERYDADLTVAIEASMPNFLNLGTDENVIFANQKFAKKKRNNSVYWKPNSRLECEIFDVAIGRIKCRSL